MKLSSNLPRARTAGFTLVEIYMVSVILIILVLAMTAAQFFAARVYTLSATKLTATASARKVMNDIRDAIRAAYSVKVGIYDPVGNTFTSIGDGTNQMGNALDICSNNPNASTTPDAIIYFMNPNASNICSVSYINNVVQTQSLVNNVVVYLTNYYVFDAEDCSNNILTLNTKNRLIHVKLQFSEWEFPLAGVVGQNAMYDYYQLQTRVAPRISDY
jgi:hypothetical protein